MSTSGDGPLPPIPARLGRLPDEVGFRRYEGAWHLVGPAHLLPIGGRVTVRKWSRTTVGRAIVARRKGRRWAEDTAEVVVTGYVAERVVHHGAGSYTRESTGRESTRYVVATFDAPSQLG